MLGGKKCLITAGPTWEAIDPVRGLTNHSSGKMGYAVAAAAVELGAKVTLISGPTCLPCPDGVERINVESAQQMYDAVHKQVSLADLFIAVAAVADYRPVDIAHNKIKKQDDSMTLTLEKTPDILASVGKLKINRPFTVGFAAETQNVLAYARSKLEAKQVDMIAANDVSQSGLGFGSDHNQLYLLTHDDTLDLGIGTKHSLAHAMLTEIAKHVHNA